MDQNLRIIITAENKAGGGLGKAGDELKDILGVLKQIRNRLRVTSAAMDAYAKKFLEISKNSTAASGATDKLAQSINSLSDRLTVNNQLFQQQTKAQLDSIQQTKASKKSVDELTESNKQLKADLGETRRQYSELSSSVAKLQQTNTKLSTAVQKQQEDYAKVSSRLREARDTIQSLQKRTSELSQKANANAAAVARQSRSIQKLQTEAKATSAAVADLRGQVGTLTTQNQQLSARVDGLQTKFTRLLNIAKAAKQAQRLLADEVQRLGRVTREQSADIARLNALWSRTIAVARQLRDRVQTLRRSLTETKQEVADLRARVRQLESQFRNLDRGGRLRGLNTSIEETSQGLKTMQGILRTLRASLISFFAFQITSGLMTGFDELINNALELDTITRRLRFSGAFAGGAEEGLRELRQLTDELGLTFEDTAKSFSLFQSTIAGTRLEGQLGNEVFRNFSEAFTTLGISGADLDGSFRAIIQTLSKGRVQAEELRNQLGERLPGAFRLAAESLGVTTGELNKMLELGQVDAQDFIVNFSRTVRDNFNGVEDAANSNRAAINRLNNAFFELSAEAGQAMLDGFRPLIDLLTTLTKSEQKANALAKALKSVGDVVSNNAQLLAWLAGADEISTQVNELYKRNTQNLFELRQVLESSMLRDLQLEVDPASVDKAKRQIEAVLATRDRLGERSGSEGLRIETQISQGVREAQEALRDLGMSSEEVTNRIRETRLEIQKLETALGSPTQAVAEAASSFDALTEKFYALGEVTDSFFSKPVGKVFDELKEALAVTGIQLEDTISKAQFREVFASGDINAVLEVSNAIWGITEAAVMASKALGNIPDRLKGLRGELQVLEILSRQSRNAQQPTPTSPAELARRFTAPSDTQAADQVKLIEKLSDIRLKINGSSLDQAKKQVDELRERITAAFNLDSKAFGLAVLTGDPEALQQLEDYRRLMKDLAEIQKDLFNQAGIDDFNKSVQEADRRAADLINKNRELQSIQNDSRQLEQEIALTGLIDQRVSDEMRIKFDLENQTRAIQEQIDNTRIYLEQRRAIGDTSTVAVLAQEVVKLEEQLELAQQLADKRREALQNETRLAELQASFRGGVGQFGANLFGGSDLIDGNFNGGLDRMQKKAQETAQVLDATLGNAINGISDGISGMILGTKSFGQAMAQMAAAVVQDLVRIAVQAMIVKFLLKPLGFGLPFFGGGGEIAGAKDGGSLQGLAAGGGVAPVRLSNGEFVFSAGAAQRLGSAKLGMLRRGMDIPETRNPISTSAARLSIGSSPFVDVTRGGLLPGPANRADSIKALAQVGQYVIPGSAVNKIGAGSLMALERGFSYGGAIDFDGYQLGGAISMPSISMAPVDVESIMKAGQGNDTRQLTVIDDERRKVREAMEQGAELAYISAARRRGQRIS